MDFDPVIGLFVIVLPFFPLFFASLVGLLSWGYPIMWLAIYFIIPIAFFPYLVEMRPASPGGDKRGYANLRAYMRRSWEAIVISIFILAWILTAIWGRDAVSQAAMDSWSSELSTLYDLDHVKGLRAPQYMDDIFLPLPGVDGETMPYYYVTSGFPFCPFLIAVDRAYLFGPVFVYSERAYYFWLPGKSILVRRKFTGIG